MIASREPRTNNHVLVRIELATGQSGIFTKLPNTYRTHLDDELLGINSPGLSLQVAEQSGILFVANMEGHISRFSATGQPVGQLLNITNQISPPKAAIIGTHMNICPYPKGDRCAVWVDESRMVQVWDCDKRDALFQKRMVNLASFSPLILQVNVLPLCNGLMFRRGGNAVSIWNGKEIGAIQNVGTVCFPFPDDSIGTFERVRNSAGQPLNRPQFGVRIFDINGKCTQAGSPPQSLLKNAWIVGGTDEQQFLCGWEDGATNRCVMRNLKTGQDCPIFSSSSTSYSHQVFLQQGVVCQTFLPKGGSPRLEVTLFGNQHGKVFDLELEEDGNLKATERKQ